MSARIMFENFHSLFEGKSSFAEKSKSGQVIFLKNPLFSLKFVFYNNYIIL